MNLTPQMAATVVIAYQSPETSWPPKILLQKRSAQSVFLPGAHVFPGGRAEATDAELGAYVAQDHENFQRIESYLDKSNHELKMYLGAALRECLEETGLALLRLKNKEENQTINKATLIKSPQKKSPPPSLSHFWPLSWWITPPGETRRYDTVFFFCLIEESEALAKQEPSTPEEHIMSEESWLTPNEALSHYEQGLIFMAPPTRAIIERMQESKSMEDFLAHVDKPLRPIEPFFSQDEQGRKILVLPGDALHHERLKPKMLLKTRYFFP